MKTTPVSAFTTTQSPAPDASPSPSFSRVMKGDLEKPTSFQEVSRRVGEYVDRVGRDQKRIDSTMRAAAAGRDLDAVELVRVQALIYGQSQRVELAAKVVQSATSSIRKLLDTQV